MMARLLPCGLTAFAAAYLAWFTTTAHYHAELANVQRDHAEQLRVMVEANAVELARVTRQAESLQQQVADLDTRYTQELTDANAESDKLRDAVAAGTQRLRILARRPASCPAVPGTTDDTGMGAGAAVELDATARRAYFNLRAGLTSDTAKLAACQDILRQLTERPDHGHRRATD